MGKGNRRGIGIAGDRRDGVCDRTLCQFVSDRAAVTEVWQAVDCGGACIVRVGRSGSRRALYPACGIRCGDNDLFCVSDAFAWRFAVSGENAAQSQGTPVLCHRVSA